MDPQGHLHHQEAENFWHVSQKSGDLDQRARSGESWKLVQVFLSGGAPWGFTLRGGLEHGEQLLITKVEEGSEAAAVSLQVGDELVNINKIPLSGFRQEAICLVKGSHKTLSLVVKRNVKMVDIVAQKMPSENDVHVARSFLTKILRSSMRQNEPISRPHSWHSTKFNESQSEAGKRQSPPTAVWNTRYDASSSASDLSAGWDQTNLRRVSDQFSSLGSMDSLEHVPHSYPTGQPSPDKSNNSMEHVGKGKRDSAYSSFSTSSITPDYTLSKSNTASTENVPSKVGQWDPGVRHNNVRNSQCFAAEGGKMDDRVTYFQLPGVNLGHHGPQSEESAGSRHSTSSRASFGPVWNVPEKKKAASPSPPPPLPPARSDSFAATKTHERGLVITHPEGPDSYSVCKPSIENRHNISPKNDSENVYTSYEKVSHDQFSSNKPYSHSYSDFRLSQVSHVNQKHQSDKSTFHPQPWATSVPKPQNVGGYHCSSQDLSPNSSTHLNQNQRRNVSTSLSSSTTDQNTESTGSSRYYCVTSCQPTQPNRLSLSDIADDRRSVAGAGLTQTGNDQSSISTPAGTTIRYNLPQQQQHSSHSKDNNTYIKHQVTTVSETPVLKPSSDDRVGLRGHGTQTAESQYINEPQTQPEHRRSLPAQFRELPQDIRNNNQVSNKIGPWTTPMLHSLSADVTEEKTGGTNSKDSLESKQVDRGSRFATTLRNEIQMRRAKLQKSTSAAALPDVKRETEEDQDVWKSAESSTPTSAARSFSNSYKDNLKEAQARVLKATSFRRKDLEPVLQELPGAEPQPSYLSSTHAWKDVHPLPTVSESVTGNSGGHVGRVGGRKRFPPEKKIQSFSEPDKIHKVGVNEDRSLTGNASSSLDQQKFMEEIEKPEFPNHTPLLNHSKNQSKQHLSSCVTEDTVKGVKDEVSTEEAQRRLYSAPSFQDHQRLGTFAEYEARWNIQKKPSEKKASEQYRSADNILSPGSEDRSKGQCFHERSRSSPSADTYVQKIPVPDPEFEDEHSQIKSEPTKLLGAHTRFSDRSSGDSVVEKSLETETYPAPPPPPMAGANSDCRHGNAAATMNHKPTSISSSLPEPGLSQPDDQSHTQPSSGPRRKPSALEKPPSNRCQEVNSHKSLTGSQSLGFTHCSANFEPSSTFYSTFSTKGESEQGKGLMDKGQEAVHHLSSSNSQPAPSLPPSSHRPSGFFRTEGQRSPSPQFSPQRLSDKPPVSHHNEESNRMEHKTENQNTTARKVPIRIVHSERNVEKQNSPFLQQSDLPLIKAEGHTVASLGSLGALGQDSLFCAFTRQKEPNNVSDSQNQQMSHGAVGDHVSPNKQPLPAAEEPRSMQETTGLTENEEQKREELARDIMGRDKSLADILDQSKMKTTMDLMEGIFPQGEQLLEGAHPRRKVQAKLEKPRPAEDREKEDSTSATVAMVTSSTYYSISAPKAELLIKMKDMQEQDEEENSEDELDMDLANKKQELIDSLSKKLQVLREAKESLLEDILDNNTLGEEVEVQVQKVCKPNELEKFRMFVGDLDKVVNLLLSLSGRLARVENALNSLEEDATPEEKHTLIEKRKLLIRQHEDAKELKENLDRREHVVYDILANYLPEDSLADYEHFVKMKSALIIEQRKLEDKIKLGEEQLKCLTDSLPIEQRLVL